jgi:hypothetical protein
MEEPAAVKIEKGDARQSELLSIDLRAGGGFIGRFFAR